MPKKLTSGEMDYVKLRNMLQPLVDKKLFTIASKESDNISKKGIIAGKLVWNQDDEKLKVFAGFSEEKLYFIPAEDRFAEQQCIEFVLKTNNDVKVKNYFKVMEYKGKVKINLSQGVIGVHNYYLRRFKEIKPAFWIQHRDIIEAFINDDKITLNGLYAVNLETHKEIIEKFPDFDRYDFSA